MSRVVAVVSHPGAVEALADLAAEHDLTVIVPGDVAPGTMPHTYPAAVPVRAPVAARIVSAAQRSAIGRNLVRISPLDQSRRLWRAVRDDPRIADLIRSADIVVAADRDAVFTVWKMTRTRRFDGPWAAVFGVAAARYAAARSAT
ncbi:hypothetical protein ACFQ0P_01640 [Microbacterium insulae]|uniref:Uncharacterized protein n=1 Tax=Microbacterium insulae TaxID=483014 RepID=A0ABW3ADP6_9MICO